MRKRTAKCWSSFCQRRRRRNVLAATSVVEALVDTRVGQSRKSVVLAAAKAVQSGEQGRGFDRWSRRLIEVRDHAPRRFSLSTTARKRPRRAERMSGAAYCRDWPAQSTKSSLASPRASPRSHSGLRRCRRRNVTVDRRSRCPDERLQTALGGFRDRPTLRGARERSGARSSTLRPPRASSRVTTSYRSPSAPRSRSWCRSANVAIANRARDECPRGAIRSASVLRGRSECHGDQYRCLDAFPDPSTGAIAQYVSHAVHDAPGHAHDSDIAET